MIVNSSIKTGFLKAKIKGKYFGLVSCSGIIRVILWRAGSPVLDSKMWVGMNLPEAIPFDEIQFESELDQPVEFWAGDVAMNQSGTVNVKGANALRTSTMDVLGTKALVVGDLTRQSVRVRTSKDIYIGGAGVSGGGWLLPAGAMEEFPVAGSLFAYKTLPLFDFAGTIDSPVTAMWPPTKNTDLGFFTVSDDEAVMFYADGQSSVTEYVKIGGGQWGQVIGSDTADYSALPNYYVDKAAGLIYRTKRARHNVDPTPKSVELHVSKDTGQTWDFLTHVFRKDAGSMVFYSEASKLCQGWIFQNRADSWSAVNVRSFEHVEGVAADLDNTAGYKSGTIIWTDFDSRNGLEIMENYPNSAGLSRGHVRRIVNGIAEDKAHPSLVGVTVDSKVWITPLGNNMCLVETSSGKLRPSSDYGETFLPKSGSMSGVYGSNPEHLFGDKWVVRVGDNTHVVYELDGEIQQDFMNVSKEEHICRSIALTALGGVFCGPETGANNHDGMRLQISIVGDMSPARVEVMELLN